MGFNGIKWVRKYSETDHDLFHKTVTGRGAGMPRNMAFLQMSSFRINRRLQLGKCFLDHNLRNGFDPLRRPRFQIDHTALANDCGSLGLCSSAHKGHRPALYPIQIAALRNGRDQRPTTAIEFRIRQHKDRPSSLDFTSQGGIERHLHDVALLEFLPHSASLPTTGARSQATISSGIGALGSHWAFSSAAV